MTEHFLQAIAFTALAIVTHYSVTGQELLLRLFLFGALFLIAVTCFLPLRVWQGYYKGRFKYTSWYLFKKTYLNVKKVIYFFLILNIVFLLISNFFSSMRLAYDIGLLIFFLLWIVFMCSILIPQLFIKDGEVDSSHIVAEIFSLCGVIALCTGFVKGILEIVQYGMLFADWAMTVSFCGAAVSAFGMYLVYLTIKVKIDKVYSDAFKKF